MSLFRYFKPVVSEVSKQCLPQPNKDLASKGIDAAMVRAANEEILKTSSICGGPSTSSGDVGGKRKRGNYTFYTPEMRAKIGKYAAEFGVNNASRKFSKELEKPVNESTVRGMKNSYLAKIKKNPGVTVKELPKQIQGRPLLLPKEADQQVQQFVTALRETGGVVNTSTVIAAAKGLFKKADPPLLEEQGGYLNLERTWARSLLQRMDFVKRKGTKSAKHSPEELDKIKPKFHRRIARRVRKFGVPDELIINWDQTGVEVIPSGNWTMHKKGDKQVDVKGIDDKRQYTALLACTLAGEMLPPQIIYQGTTERCHANVVFPDDWDIWHSPTHWSNSETMDRYLDKIILPYVKKTQERLGTDAQPLLIFDVFKAHKTDDFLQKITDSGAHVVFVPARCTDELQPLDATVNGKYKQLIKSEFQRWFADKVAAAVDEGKQIADIAQSIDLKTSTIKPVHGKWLIKVHNIIRHEQELIVQGFTKTGIAKAAWDARAGPVPALDDSDAEDADWECE